MSEAESGPDSRWPWFVGALIIAAYAGLYRIRTFDTFFHLAAGRWISTHGEIPRADPFSYSFPGAPWHDHSWGFQWVLWHLHDAGGYAALSVAVALACAIGFALGIGRDGLAKPYLLPWALLPFVLFRDVWCPRPHVVAFLGLAGMLQLLHLARQRARPGILWAIVPLHAAWVTAHGSHLLVIPCLALYGIATAVASRFGACDQGRARAASLHLAGVIATLAFVTWFLAPDALSLGFEHVGSDALRRYIPEWAPLRLTDVFGSWAGWAAAAALAWTIGGIWPAWRDGSSDPEARSELVGRLTLLFLLTVLGLTSRRMLALWLFGAMPLWLPFADAAMRRVAARLETLATWRVQLPLVALALFALGLRTINDAPTFAPGAGLDERRPPVGAVAYMRMHPELRFERSFHAYNFGGYLMLERPEHGVLVDGRAITVYPPEFLDGFVAIYDEPSRFDRFAQLYEIDSVLLPVGSRRTGELRWYLDAHPRWQPVYSDRTCALWVIRETGSGENALRP